MIDSYFKDDAIAAAAFLSKYADKGEESPDQMHMRMAKEFARIRFKKDNTKSKKEWEDYFYNLFMYFKYIVPQGSVMATLGTKNISSLSNCFVVGQPHDSYSGIIQKDEELASLMKRRGGVGLDLSTLRPRDTIVNNAASSSTGAASFMDRYSNTTREVAQEGRRGALMLTMDIRHPDILEFINAKKDRTKVTGANISVMLRDDFMEAVKKDEDYILRFPCDTKYEDITREAKIVGYNELSYDNGVYIKRIKAKEIYNAIVENAWENAEPGQMFIDKHWSYSPDGGYSAYKMVTTNPCGEIGMSAYDACRLILLNLTSFIKDAFSDKSSINYTKLYDIAYEMQLMADDLVDLELEYIDRIISKIKSDDSPKELKNRELSVWLNVKDIASKSRRTGCGITGLGDMLAMLNLAYDSEESKEVTEKVMKTIFKAELQASIDLAKKFGPFSGWSPSLETNDFFKMIKKEFKTQYEQMCKFGRRNVSWSTVAPAGTVSLMTQTTSGLEPLFAPYYIRRKKVNPSDKDVRVDFTDQNGDCWQEYAVLHPKFKEWLKIEYKPLTDGDSLTDEDISLLDNKSLGDLFFMSPWYKSTANDIDWVKRVELQKVIQKYTSHSISSTINLPKEATKEDVSNIYIKAWEEGLKGVTVYRDGSRSGVLINNKEEDFKQHNAPKRPKDLPGYISVVTVKGVKYNVIVGLLNDHPYEVFAHLNEGTSVISGATIITKQKSGEYVYKDSKIIRVSKDMDDSEEALTRMTSTALRHGTNIKFVVEQLNKTKGDLTSFSKAIARVLKTYIPDGTESSLSCLECNSKTIIFEEGCEKCTNCGSSKCG